MRQRAREILAIALALAFLGAASAARSDDTVRVTGSVTWVSLDAVEVGGHRGIFDDASDVRSDGRPVARSSIRAGMPADMELDAAGRVLELRVIGVVE